MKELYELKDLVCDELKEYGKKGEISMGNLDVIDKLSHTLKSLETIIAMEEAEGGNGCRAAGTAGKRGEWANCIT